jgi:hypothetical protein
MSLYESFLKEAVETLQIVKDELKNDPVSTLNTKRLVSSFSFRPLNLFQHQPPLVVQHVKVVKNYPMVFGFIVILHGFVFQK